MVHYIFFYGLFCILTARGLVDLLDFPDWLGGFSYMDIFFIGGQFYGLDGLGGHDAQDVLPVMADALFPEHVPDGVYQLVGQYGQINPPPGRAGVCFDPFIILMENGPDAQIRLQAPEGVM